MPLELDGFDVVEFPPSEIVDMANGQRDYKYSIDANAMKPQDGSKYRYCSLLIFEGHPYGPGEALSVYQFLVIVNQSGALERGMSNCGGYSDYASPFCTAPVGLRKETAGGIASILYSGLSGNEITVLFGSSSRVKSFLVSIK